MTCITAVIEPSKGVVMAADNQSSTDSLKIDKASPKIWRNGDFLIGVAGSVRVSQVIKHCLQIPLTIQNVDHDSIEKWMVVDFVDAMRNLLKDKALLNVYEAVESMEHSQIIVAWKDRVFRLWSDLQCEESRLEYSAAGSGTFYALGAMRQTKFFHKDHQIELLPATLAIAGVEAAIEFDPFCGGNITTHSNF